MKKIISLFIAAALVVALAAGCAVGVIGGADGPTSVITTQTPVAAQSGAAAEAEKLRIVATIFPEYDFARAIAGDKADISMLVQPGASVHSYEPSPADMVNIMNADIFIYVGGETDDWIDGMLEAVDTSEMQIIRLMDHVDVVEEEIKEGMEEEEGHDHAHAEGEANTEEDHAHEEEDHAEGDHDHEEEDHAEEEGHEHEEGEVALDEHVWTSPKNAIKFIDVIGGAISARDPANAALYDENSEKYKAELTSVDSELKAVVDAAARRKIIVADRFPYRYFTDAYGLDYAAAFPGCVDQSDAAPQTIAFLINAVKQENIPYIYCKELSNQNVAKAVAEETGAGLLQLNSCENLSRTDFEAGLTYVELMRQNVESLQKGLN